MLLTPVVGIILVCVILGCVETPEGENLTTIEELKGEAWSGRIGNEVTVEGIFVRDPIPILVTRLDSVLLNLRPPDQVYILLTGGVAQEMEPKEIGGAKLRVTGTVQAVDLQEYPREYVSLDVNFFEVVDKLKLYNPEPVPFVIEPPTVLQPHRYAILFSGGGDPTFNYIRYWNDLKFMYSTLINTYGFSEDNIAVLYADGKGALRPDGTVDTQMPVHYKGTQADLETVFNLLKKSSTGEDLIFFFTTDHGGGFCKTGCMITPKVYGGRADQGGDEGDVLAESQYGMDLDGDGSKDDEVTWDEELCGWGESIYDDAFHTMLSGLRYDRMVIVMEQCFSGGMIADMAQGGTNRVIMSAAGEHEPSEAMDYDYNEFSYYFTCAINGADPDGNAVNADTNNDGRVSMVEAFNYARTNDTRPETPWYEDSGDGVPHSGSMPGGGEGTLGGDTSLD